MGQMGRALASRLVDTGHEVIVWNRTPGRAGSLVEQGATEAATPAEAAEAAEVTFSVLTSDDAVAGVLLAQGRPLPLASGGYVVDCSTVAPATTRRLAAFYDGRLAACPILGGPAALAGGSAGLVVAGPGVVIDAIEGVLGSISGTVRRCGDDPGLALVVKLVSNYLLMAGIAVLAEAVAAAQRNGLDDGFIIDTLSASAMVAPGLHNRIADLVAGDHDGWFPPAMGAKDVGLFIDLAATAQEPLPIAALVASRYHEADGLGDPRDLTAIIELLRR
jgi:3-hydroxyisobutyrate dehydrogenase-like beta-hydroxyacid dehydrogenase